MFMFMFMFMYKQFINTYLISSPPTAVQFKSTVRPLGEQLKYLI